ncbi:MAG: glycosyltransferase family 4 protein [Candidatus Aminicenantes bacterium]|nr:glycosyltransferase family 4 protein [Candidatus Aminicenantes bacterium]
MSLFHIDAGKEWRGGQRQSLFLVREIYRRGYPVYFVVQPKSPLHKKAKEAGLPILPVRMRSEADLLAVVRLAVFMKMRKCRLAHFHDAHSLAVGSAAASLAGTPIRIMTRRVDFPLKKNFFSKRKYQKNLDALIAISKGVKKVLVEGGVDPQLVKVIPSGIDFSPYTDLLPCNYLRKELSFKPKDFLVGIIAHLADHKGHKYLIRAAKILKEKAPRIKVIIVGKGPLEMELKQQSRKSHVDDMVYFLGFREDIPQILCSLDVFVLSSYLEGMGSTILDAMACSLPVVATRTGGIPEVVKNTVTGILVPPKDPAALSEAILTLYKDKKLGRELGVKGSEVVREKYSAESMAGKVMDLYERIAVKKGIKLDGEHKD